MIEKGGEVDPPRTEQAEEGGEGGRPRSRRLTMWDIVCALEELQRNLGSIQTALAGLDPHMSIQVPRGRYARGLDSLGVNKPGECEISGGTPGVNKPGECEVGSGINKPGECETTPGTNKPGECEVTPGVNKPGECESVPGVNKPGECERPNPRYAEGAAGPGTTKPGRCAPVATPPEIT